MLSIELNNYYDLASEQIDVDESEQLNTEDDIVKAEKLWTKVIVQGDRMVGWLVVWL